MRPNDRCVNLLPNGVAVRYAKMRRRDSEIAYGQVQMSKDA